MSPLSSRTWLLLLAVTLCLLNGFKPLTVDDAVYAEYARHIVRHPLDPYGFTLGPGAEPANEILAPAGLLYWWAGVLRLVGESPFGWKLGLFPFCLLFTFALASLARRLARGLEVPLVALVLLSPAVLPCLNLMLDLPALALSLAATVLFLQASDRNALPRALLAGLVAGLAMQTKYTSFVTPLLFLAAGVLLRRKRLAVCAAGLAVLVFVGWEAFLVARHGQSHFLIAVAQRRGPLAEKLKLALPLVGILGGVASGQAFVALAGLGGSRRLGWALAGLLALGCVLVALVPDRHAELIPSGEDGRALLSLNTLVFGGFGALLLALSGGVVLRLLSQREEEAEQRLTWLLVAWLALEVAGYFALSPYPAVRRVMGLVVVGALTAGRLVSCRLESGSAQRSLLRLGVGCSLLGGLVSFAVDFDHYRVEKQAARRAHRRIRQLNERLAGVPERGTIWYRGIGSFEFYAAGRGMRRLDVRHAEPRPGDWLVVPVFRGGAALPADLPALWQVQDQVVLRSPLPLRSGYQFGGTAVDHHEGPLLTLALYRYQEPTSAPSQTATASAPGSGWPSTRSPR